MHGFLSPLKEEALAQNNQQVSLFQSNNLDVQAAGIVFCRGLCDGSLTNDQLTAGRLVTATARGGQMIGRGQGDPSLVVEMMVMCRFDDKKPCKPQPPLLNEFSKSVFKRVYSSL